MIEPSRETTAKRLRAHRGIDPILSLVEVSKRDARNGRDVLVHLSSQHAAAGGPVNLHTFIRDAIPDEGAARRSPGNLPRATGDQLGGNHDPLRAAVVTLDSVKGQLGG
jgi:hypothetical protein